jgi:hypothetical protein
VALFTAVLKEIGELGEELLIPLVTYLPSQLARWYLVVRQVIASHLEN